MNVNWKIRVARSTTTKKRDWFNIKSKTEQKTTSMVSFHVHNKANGEGMRSF